MMVYLGDFLGPNNVRECIVPELNRELYILINTRNVESMEPGFLSVNIRMTSGYIYNIACRRPHAAIEHARCQMLSDN